jgi:hypothetical protein
MLIVKPRLGLVSGRADLQQVSEETGRTEVGKAERAVNAF